MKTFIEIFGWYGTFVILLAYALVSFNILESSSMIFQLLNLTGAAGLVVVSLKKRAYQPGALNAIWAIIALVAVAQILF